jgi:hypothetical protein
VNPNNIGVSRRTSFSSILPTNNPDNNSQENLSISSFQDFISDVKRIKNNEIHKIDINKDIKKLKNNFENIFKML